MWNLPKKFPTWLKESIWGERQQDQLGGGAQEGCSSLNPLVATSAFGNIPAPLPAHPCFLPVLGVMDERVPLAGAAQVPINKHPAALPAGSRGAPCTSHGFGCPGGPGG